CSAARGGSCNDCSSPLEKSTSFLWKKVSTNPSAAFAGPVCSDIFCGHVFLCLNPTSEPAIREPYHEGQDQHRHQATHGAREKCCVDLRKRKFRELLPALDHPMPSHVGDERRHNDDAQPLRDRVSEDEIERGN